MLVVFDSNIGSGLMIKARHFSLSSDVAYFGLGGGGGLPVNTKEIVNRDIEEQKT